MERIMSSRNLTQLTDFYQLTMMQGYFFSKDVNETVVFDAFYRSNPNGNGYAIIEDYRSEITALLNE